MAKYPNHRRVKINRNYTIEEIASLFSLHKNTVRGWVKNGLPTINNGRPALFLGSEVRDFLQLRRKKSQRHCPPGTLYCLRCREPKTPYGKMLDYHPITESVGNLSGLCPDCGSGLNQFIGSKRLQQISQILDVSIPLAQKHISGCS
jgi:hypothetical protein